MGSSRFIPFQHTFIIISFSILFCPLRWLWGWVAATLRTCQASCLPLSHRLHRATSLCLLSTTALPPSLSYDYNYIGKYTVHPLHFPVKIHLNHPIDWRLPIMVWKVGVYFLAPSLSLSDLEVCFWNQFVGFFSLSGVMKRLSEVEMWGRGAATWFLLPLFGLRSDTRVRWALLSSAASSSSFCHCAPHLRTEAFTFFCIWFII